MLFRQRTKQATVLLLKNSAGRTGVEGSHPAGSKKHGAAVVTVLVELKLYKAYARLERARLRNGNWEQ
jgi:hypothetical protein